MLGVAGAALLTTSAIIWECRRRANRAGASAAATPRRSGAARDEALRARSLALDAISEAVLIVHEDGRILDCNSAALTLFGRHRQNIEREFAPSLRTLGADSAPAYQSARDRGVWSGESTARLPDGSSRLCLTRIVPIHDRSGGLAVYCESYRDVVSERLVSQDLRDRLFGVQVFGDLRSETPAPHASLARLGAVFRDLESLLHRYEQVVEALSDQDLAEPLAGLVSELRDGDDSDDARSLQAEIPALLASLRARMTRRETAHRS